MPLLAEMIGHRVDKALGFYPEIGTRSKASWLIENSRVLINKKQPKNSQLIQENDSIEIWFPEATPSQLLPLDLKLNVLFEDDDLIVLNKPAGLVIHPAAGHEQDTLVNALLNHTKNLSMRFGEQRPGIVHRLDKETSGILVVAKNDLAHESLSSQFKTRTIHRKYFAATIGKPLRASGRIESCLARHSTDRKRFASVRDSNKKIIADPSQAPAFGKWSITNYLLLKTLPSGLSYLELKLETGRTHQIRVHLSEMGCPIIADHVYGADHKVKPLPNNQRTIVQGFPRFALHAAELGFNHPKTQAPMFFSTPWPDDLQPLLMALGLLD